MPSVRGLTAARFFLFLVLTQVPALASAGTLVGDINQCIAEIKREQGKSRRLHAEIDFYCPGLTERINRSTIAANLSRKVDSSSSITELRDLRHFLLLQKRRTASDRYQFVNVDSVVKEILQEKHEAPPGLWDRFVKWLEQYLPKLDKEDWEKLDKFMESIRFPEWLNDALFYGSGVLILILSFWVLYREWRYYRRVGALREAAIAGGPLPAALQRRELVPLDAVPGLPLRWRVPALLNWVIHYFEERGELPANHSLTNRELARILRREKSGHCEYFVELVGTSEQVVYGNVAPSEEKVESLMKGARSLEPAAGEEAK